MPTEPTMRLPRVVDSTMQFPRVVDSTMLACLGQCEQKFFNEFVLGIAPYAVSIDLLAGGAFARGLELFRLNHYKHSIPFRDSAAIVFEEFSRFWGDYDPTEYQGEYHAKDFVNIFAALLDYFRVYPMETDELQPLVKTNGEPAVEFTFSIPLELDHPDTGEPLLYGGRCDMIGTHHGVLKVVDEKTTKNIGDNWARQWNMRGQFIGYVWAARAYGFNVQQALVRGTAMQKTQYVHAEATMIYSNRLIERWYESIHSRLQRAIMKYEIMQEMKKDHYRAWEFNFGDSCTSYGVCPYATLCQSVHPPEWYGDFDRRIWNPLEKDPTKGSASRSDGIEPITLQDAMMGVR